MAKEISKSRIPNFPGLVLFCIDTSDSESRRIFQHFSRSTRLSHLSTAPVLISALFFTSSLNFPDFWKFFADFSANRAFFVANFTEYQFYRNCGKLERENFPFSRGKGKDVIFSNSLHSRREIFSMLVFFMLFFGIALILA